ncbi:MAG: hemerythrin domain-containing protein [Planctomycetota bacterium]|jgi:hemerythrin-like domain-containing protein
MEPTAAHESYLGNLLAEHQELMRKVTDLKSFWREVCELGIGPKCFELADRISDIREHLREHFDVEERDGYLGPALAVAPRYSEEADELRAQHVTFLQTLDSMASRLRTGDPEVWNSICDEVEKFVDDLQTHEHLENDIVQAAFTDDTGAGD